MTVYCGHNYALGTRECGQQYYKYKIKPSKKSDVDVFDKLLAEITRDE